MLSANGTAGSEELTALLDATFVELLVIARTHAPVVIDVDPLPDTASVTWSEAPGAMLSLTEPLVRRQVLRPDGVLLTVQSVGIAAMLAAVLENVSCAEPKLCWLTGSLVRLDVVVESEVSTVSLTLAP